MLQEVGWVGFAMVPVETLERAGAVLKGHFLFTSGLHGDTYVEKFRIIERPELLAPFCSAIAGRFESERPQAVLGPALGGVVLAYEVARLLGARCLFAERENGRLALRRGFRLNPGERVLVVEDVITTGGSVREVIRLALDAGAHVVGVGALVNRSPKPVELGRVRLETMIELPLKAWEPQDCPLCRQGVPISHRGSHRAEGAGGVEGLEGAEAGFRSRTVRS